MLETYCAQRIRSWNSFPANLAPPVARYTHRVAISNHRLVNFADGQVTFRWEGLRLRQQTEADDSHSRGVSAPLSSPCASTWLCAHRFFGFLANRRRNSLLPLCQQLRQMASVLHSPDSIQPTACSRTLWQCPRRVCQNWPPPPQTHSASFKRLNPN